MQNIGTMLQHVRKHREKKTSGRKIQLQKWDLRRISKHVYTSDWIGHVLQARKVKQYTIEIAAIPLCCQFLFLFLLELLAFCLIPVSTHLDFVLILIFWWFLLVLIPFSSSCVLWPLFQCSPIQDILAHLISKIKHCIDWFGYGHSMAAVERGVGNHRVCKARALEVDERIWKDMKGRKVSHTQSHSHWGARAQWNIQPTSINHWWFCCTSAKKTASPIPWASCARSWATSSPSLLSRVAGSWVNDPMITATRASKIFNTHWYTHSYRRQSCQSCQACQSCQSCQWSGSFHPKHHTLRGGLAAAARTPSDWKFSFAHRHREKGDIKAFKAGRATRCRTKRTRQQQKNADRPGTSRHSSPRLNISKVTWLHHLHFRRHFFWPNCQLPSINIWLTYD